MPIHTRRVLVPIVLGSLLAVGCVKTGSVSVSQPVEAKVAQYKTVVVSAASDTAELQKYLPKLQEGVAKSLQHDKVFATATAGGQPADGALTLRMKVVKSKGGNKAARMFNVGGETEVEVTCELVDEQANTTLAKFIAKGNSARKSKSSINGFDTSIADDLDGRAVRAAGEQIATFLAENTNH
jgi:hypothetical protein